MLVTVNNRLIPDEQINLESGHVEQGSIEERQDEAARRLAIRELLRQRAEAAGFDVSADSEAAIDALLATELEVPAADDASCRRYFEANRECFRSPEEVELRHMLLAAAPDDPAARVRRRDEAESLIDALRDNREDFAALAARRSDCPSAEQGGHLGLVGRGQTVPEFERVILRLPVGLADRPVETRYGFHIVEVLQRRGGEPLDYEQVRHLIADYLRERSWRRAVSQYIGQLAAGAEIRGVDIETPDSPLVQ